MTNKYGLNVRDFVIASRVIRLIALVLCVVVLIAGHAEMALGLFIGWWLGFASTVCLVKAGQLGSDDFSNPPDAPRYKGR